MSGQTKPAFTQHDADELIETLHKWHNGNAELGSLVAQFVTTLLGNLKRRRLLAEREDVDTLVLRDRIHGGPMLLDTHDEEVFFASEEFAKACQQHWSNLYVRVLRIVS